MAIDCPDCGYTADHPAKYPENLALSQLQCPRCENKFSVVNDDEPTA